MNEENIQQKIYYCETKGLIIKSILVLLLALIISFLPNISWDEYNPLLEKYLCLSGFLIVFISPILCYFANKKSYIELGETGIIVRKPNIYPFLQMETINISYEDLKEIKICNRGNDGRGIDVGYMVVFVKKDEFGKNKKIRFYGLDKGNSFGNSMKTKDVKVHFM